MSVLMSSVSAPNDRVSAVADRMSRRSGTRRVAAGLAVGVIVATFSLGVRLDVQAAGTEDGPAPGATTAAPLTLGGASSTTVAYGSATTTASTASKAASASDYEAGKLAVSKGDWKQAIAIFTAVTTAEPGNADAWNLLGYATRKNGDPKAAIPLYAKALALNPRHRGALEYQGEAFVETKQLTKARANLAALKRVCGTSCEEYKDLAAAIKKK
jgi:tetratricopeptide (TPR) repeat protein